MPEGLQVVLTVTAEAEVTKAAGIRQWCIRGTFEDDEATVEVGNRSVYLRTGNRDDGCPAMFRPDSARELARALIAAADKSEPREKETP